jgi:LysR family nitrogen assimilation transcriptional regulator
VVDAGNMTAAAAKLALAQPALGQQIRLLEKELDVALITRHSRGVTPTQAGILLYERARKILDDVEAAERDVRRLSSDRRDHLVLGVNPTLVLTLGPDLPVEARKELPDVTVSLVEERSPVLLDALESGQINVSFLYNAPERPKIERRAVMEEDLLLISAPDKALEGTSVSLAQALEYDLVIAGERGVIRQIVEAEARRLGLRLRLAYEVHSVTSMKAMIARGDAVSIMPWSLAAKELTDGTLMARRIDRPALTWTLYLARKIGAPPFLHEDEIMRYLDRIVERCIDKMQPYARAMR